MSRMGYEPTSSGMVLANLQLFAFNMDKVLKKFTDQTTKCALEAIEGNYLKICEEQQKNQ